MSDDTTNTDEGVQTEVDTPETDTPETETEESTPAGEGE